MDSLFAGITVDGVHMNGTRNGPAGPNWEAALGLRLDLGIIGSP